MTRHRNSDDRVRALERAARQQGSPDAVQTWLAELRRTGHSAEQVAFVLTGLLEDLFSNRLIAFDQHGDDEVNEAFRRVHRTAPDLDDTHCETNDCEELSCHRCFTREGCRLHAKCIDFTRRGDAAFVERGEALRAIRWLILQRALNDGSSGWGGPDLPALGEDPELRAMWLAWASEDAMANADAISRERVRKVVIKLQEAVDAAWDFDYAGALAAVKDADSLVENKDEDEFVCSRCERTAYDRGRYSCGECEEQFCNLCENEGGAHPGYHSCYGNCIRCFSSLEEPSAKNDWYDGDLCADCRAKDAEGAEANPYYGRAGSGIMFFSPDGRRVLLTLRSDEVEEPGTWGVPGGKLDGRDVYASALREVREELGSVPQHVLFDKVVYEDGGFRYTTFLARLDASAAEWSPRLNWESDDVDWFDIEALPDDLHFGVEHVVRERPALFTGAVHDEDVTRAGRANPRRPRR